MVLEFGEFFRGEQGTAVEFIELVFESVLYFFFHSLGYDGDSFDHSEILHDRRFPDWLFGGKVDNNVVIDADTGV